MKKKCKKPKLHHLVGEIQWRPWNRPEGHFSQLFEGQVEFFKWVHMLLTSEMRRASNFSGKSSEVKSHSEGVSRVKDWRTGKMFPIFHFFFINFSNFSIFQLFHFFHFLHFSMFTLFPFEIWKMKKSEKLEKVGSGKMEVWKPWKIWKMKKNWKSEKSFAYSSIFHS